MTAIPQAPVARPVPARQKQSLLVASPEMKRRNAAEARFKAYGLIAIAVSLITLAIMLFTIVRDGSSAFFQAKLSFPLELSAEVLDPQGNRLREEMTKVTTCLLYTSPSPRD